MPRDTIVTSPISRIFGFAHPGSDFPSSFGFRISKGDARALVEEFQMPGMRRLMRSKFHASATISARLTRA
jgi:hypothetical protein